MGNDYIDLGSKPKGKRMSSICHTKLPSAKSDFDKTSITRKIEATDRQIDELVYELYGLTEEEIKIVEGKA
jgi:hypothetical protein